MSDVTKLSKATIGLHWLAAALLLFMIPGGLVIDEFEKGPFRSGWIDFHRSLGLIVLVVALVRLSWRLKEGFPPPLSDTPRWEQLLKQGDHWLLLIGSLTMPLSGIVMNVAGGRGLFFFGLEVIAKSGVKTQPWASLAANGHSLGGDVMLAGVVLHIIGLTRRAIRSKDGTLRRMFGLRVTPKA
jgi:cytochrome b561